jgi:hypothetical protein
LPTYERGDYVKVEFPDEATGVGEWMWVRVHHCDDEKKLVFGTLDNKPVNLIPMGMSIIRHSVTRLCLPIANH